MKRREFIAQTGIAALGLGLSQFPLGWSASAAAPRRRILFFTKSSSFEHSVIKRQGDKLSYAEQMLTDWGQTHGFDVTCSKDGSLFNPEYLAQFDAFCFYTTGDLTQSGTDKQPPMSPEGKTAFLEAVRNGKGFIGIHAGNDTFHTLGDRFQYDDEDKLDPYIAMIGGEFIRHGAQQSSHMIPVDKRFPGCKDLGDGFDMREEWYTFKNFAKDLHVLLVQDTKGMTGEDYQRPPFPATWARRHGKGRVFYTSMGHREDVWTTPVFQSVLLGGIAWTTGNAKAKLTPNLEQVAPGYRELPYKKG